MTGKMSPASVREMADAQGRDLNSKHEKQQAESREIPQRKNISTQMMGVGGRTQS